MCQKPTKLWLRESRGPTYAWYCFMQKNENGMPVRPGTTPLDMLLFSPPIVCYHINTIHRLLWWRAVSIACPSDPPNNDAKAGVPDGACSLPKFSATKLDLAVVLAILQNKRNIDFIYCCMIDDGGGNFSWEAAERMEKTPNTVVPGLMESWQTSIWLTMRKQI